MRKWRAGVQASRSNPPRFIFDTRSQIPLTCRVQRSSTIRTVLIQCTVAGQHSKDTRVDRGKSTKYDTLTSMLLLESCLASRVTSMRDCATTEGGVGEGQRVTSFEHTKLASSSSSSSSSLFNSSI